MQISGTTEEKNPQEPFSVPQEKNPQKPSSSSVPLQIPFHNDDLLLLLD